MEVFLTKEDNDFIDQEDDNDINEVIDDDSSESLLLSQHASCDH
jgi:hypothetical protein